LSRQVFAMNTFGNHSKCCEHAHAMSLVKPDPC
jgi:hypothetical protein